MKKILIQYSLVLCLGTCASTAFALSDDYYNSGEDLDLLVETKSTHAIEEIEYKLRKFVLYRKLEDLLFDLNEEYPGINSF